MGQIAPPKVSLSPGPDGKAVQVQKKARPGCHGVRHSALTCQQERAASCQLARAPSNVSGLQVSLVPSRADPIATSKVTLGPFPVFQTPLLCLHSSPAGLLPRPQSTGSFVRPIASARVSLSVCTLCYYLQSSIAITYLCIMVKLWYAQEIYHLNHF